MVLINSSLFSGYFITACFLFSTLYGLNYYATGQTDSEIEAIDISGTSATKEGTLKTLLQTLSIDGILEFLSVLNPFILLKFILSNLLAGNDLVYEVINLFFLRPIGWITSFLTIDYLINKIRGVSN